ncbi:MAG: type II toxin-antitoxin system RatA family toxin [Gammaproteobacteria bacterium]|nr:type II toxin-antitoxin system RatA family toxin [Gammaproteobacteria bacterium]
MVHVQRNALLPYTAAQMYRLVNDIEAYSEFVPWCDRSEVLRSTAEETEATLHFSRGGFGASMTTRNELIENRKVIVNLVEGPFKHLKGIWQFHEVDERTCKVELEIKFAFSNRLYAFTLGPIFHSLANRMIAVFRQRAKETYEKR